MYESTVEFVDDARIGEAAMIGLAQSLRLTRLRERVRAAVRVRLPNGTLVPEMEAAVAQAMLVLANRCSTVKKDVEGRLY